MKTSVKQITGGLEQRLEYWLTTCELMKLGVEEQYVLQ